MQEAKLSRPFFLSLLLILCTISPAEVMVTFKSGATQTYDNYYESPSGYTFLKNGKQFFFPETVVESVEGEALKAAPHVSQHQREEMIEHIDWKAIAAKGEERKRVLYEASELIDHYQPLEAITLLLEYRNKNREPDYRIDFLLLDLAEKHPDHRLDADAIRYSLLWSAPWSVTGDLYSQMLIQTEETYIKTIRDGYSEEHRNHAGTRYASLRDFRSQAPYPIQLLQVLGGDPKPEAERVMIRQTLVRQLIAEADREENGTLRALCDNEMESLWATAGDQMRRDLESLPDRYYESYSAFVRQQLLDELQAVRSGTRQGDLYEQILALLPYGLDRTANSGEFVRVANLGRDARSEQLFNAIKDRFEGSSRADSGLLADVKFSMWLLSRIQEDHPPAKEFAGSMPQRFVEKVEVSLLLGTKPEPLLRELTSTEEMLQKYFPHLSIPAAFTDIRSKLIREVEAEEYAGRIRGLIRRASETNLDKAEQALTYFGENYEDTIAYEAVQREQLDKQIEAARGMMAESAQINEEKRRRFEATANQKQQLQQEAKDMTLSFLKNLTYGYDTSEFWKGEPSGFSLEGVYDYDYLGTSMLGDEAFIVNEETQEILVSNVAKVNMQNKYGVRIFGNMAFVYTVNIETGELKLLTIL